MFVKVATRGFVMSDYPVDRLVRDISWFPPLAGDCETDACILANRQIFNSKSHTFRYFA